ncbi:MAG: class I SAM-dependent methyltransferase [Nitrospirae bacterium]|nr:MAG: class I SAM-dependent methyltransferase [Nitrospirota bacterium]
MTANWHAILWPNKSTNSHYYLTSFFDEFLVNNCLICNSVEVNQVFRKAEFTYFRCHSCGMLLVDLQLAPAEVFSHYSKAYYEAEASRTDGRRGYPSYRNARDTLEASFVEKLAVVRRHVPSGRLLDAGAAYGLFLSTAASHFEGIGIDVSEYAASVARDEFGMNVQARDIERTGLPDDHFDAIVLWDIIEHLIHPIDALREMHRVLKPGGWIFISTDDAAHWLPRLLGSQWWALAAPLHLCHFSKRGMTVAFQRARLELKEFAKDPRRYSVSDIIKHFGVSYQSSFLANIGTSMEQNALGRWVFHVTRPEQFIAIGRKPGELIEGPVDHSRP